MDKKTTSLMMILILATGISTWLMLIITQQISMPQHIGQKSDPDFFMTKAVYTQLNNKGEITSEVQTPSLTHFAAKDTYLFENPTIKNTATNHKIWLLRAAHGKSEHGSAKISLWDNVKLIQQSSNAPDLTVTTKAIDIYSKQKIAETDQPVIVSQAGSIVKAIGAKINFADNTVKLLSNITGEYSF